MKMVQKITMIVAILLMLMSNISKCMFADQCQSGRERAFQDGEQEEEGENGSSVEQNEQDEQDEVEACSICLGEVTEDIKHLPCMHAFHRDCIDWWLSDKDICPDCGKPVEQEIPVESQRPAASREIAEKPGREGYIEDEQRECETIDTCTLVHCTLTDCVVQSSKLIHCILIHCTLNNCSFTQSEARNCTIKAVQKTIERSTLKDCRLELEYCQIVSSKLENTGVPRARRMLTGCSLKKATLQQCVLKNCRRDRWSSFSGCVEQRG